MITQHTQPRTTFAGPNPFAPAPRAKTRRDVAVTSPPVRQVLSVIYTNPGLTSGDLIKRTGNKAADQYAKSLVEAGEARGVYKKSKPGHFKPVIHFYPAGEMQ